jgi:hypothetical protein
LCQTSSDLGASCCVGTLVLSLSLSSLSLSICRDSNLAIDAVN